MANEFDIITCQEMLVDHAFTFPLALLAGRRALLLPIPV